MKIQDKPPLHLTYCLNVHRGEAWEDCLGAIRDYALKVRDRVGQEGPFGLGLRLGDVAAKELAKARVRKAFKEFLQRENLYVFTVNAFPFGQFHQSPVKENVYSPDWRTGERREYTNRVADILADLLPEGVDGSISTVFLETTDEAIEFIKEMMPANVGGDLLSYLGVCFDTSHQAVEFEDLAGSLGRLIEAQVPVGKIHLSSALQVRPTAKALERLEAFCDGVYLHQVKAMVGGQVVSYADLPAALAAAAGEPDMKEMRVHFHVPLYFQSHAGLFSTSGQLTGKFAERVRAGASSHLEIETYTFDVLPGEVKTADITESIAREYEWVRANVTSRAGR
ncbi:MAG: hypothetical protein NTV86_19125 [Planctomycetota bacterium]|nr:hypothetical protein [Planctomycetota bacterium]